MSDAVPIGETGASAEWLDRRGPGRRSGDTDAGPWTLVCMVPDCPWSVEYEPAATEGARAEYVEHQRRAHCTASDGRPEFEHLGLVTDAGGGEVTVLVDRELARYPQRGAEVLVRQRRPSAGKD